jgi:hypothetical protein
MPRRNHLAAGNGRIKSSLAGPKAESALELVLARRGGDHDELRIQHRICKLHDRWLAYGKAGTAYEHTDFTASAASALPLAFGATGSDNRTGWTVGGGLEWAISDSWSIKGEYDYLDFGSRSLVLNGATTFAAPPAVPTVVTTLNNQRISEFKFGINWKFMPNFW